MLRAMAIFHLAQSAMCAVKVQPAIILAHECKPRCDGAGERDMCRPVQGAMLPDIEVIRPDRDRDPDDSRREKSRWLD